MKNCEVLKPFISHYEVSPSEADFSQDQMVEKDGIVVKARRHLKRVIGQVESLRPSFNETYDKQEDGSYQSRIAGMKIIVRDSHPYDVINEGSGILTLPDDFAADLESKGLVRII